MFIHFCFHCIRLYHHFHSSTVFITFTHLESQFFLFTYIVSCIQRYCHIRSPPSALHTSTVSLPLIIISSVHFYCHLHSHSTCPCGACTGMVKAHTGTGLLILCLYRPCMGMIRVSLPLRVSLFFSFCLLLLLFFVCLLIKDLIGSQSYSDDVTLNILLSVYIFQHTVTRLLLNLENTSHFFQLGHNFCMK